MSPLLQVHLSCVRHSFLLHAMRALLLTGLLAVVSCGDISCPEPLSNVDGMCLKLDAVAEPDPVAEVESCDGVDNDGDREVDEDWPALGEPCGEGAALGECVKGKWLCANDGQGLVCEGAVGPVAEVCDGKDNDCDGLVDEGVLSVKAEVFNEYATVTAVDGGFVVARLVGDALRVQAYDTSGEPRGAFDVVDSPAEQTSFLVSDSAGERVLVALGRYSFHVVDVRVDSDLGPVIVESQELNSQWNQPRSQEGYPAWGAFAPPIHPRVLASPARFIGYPDLLTFALNPFGNDDQLGLARAPTVVTQFPFLSAFDAAGPYVVWEQGNNVRVGWVLDDGKLELDIDVARGESPGIAMRSGGPGVVYMQDGVLGVSELDSATLRCSNGGFCGDVIYAEESQERLVGPTALAYDEAGDTWFVVAGTELLVLARANDGAVVKQVAALDSLSNAPRRVDVAVSDGTAAVVQAAPDGESALTFVGCF